MERLDTITEDGREWPYEVGDEIHVQFDYMEAKMYPNGHTEVSGEYDGYATITCIEHDARCDVSTFTIDAFEMEDGISQEQYITEDQIVLNASVLDHIIFNLTQL